MQLALHVLFSYISLKEKTFCMQWVVAYSFFSLFLQMFSSVVHMFPFPLLSRLENNYHNQVILHYIWEWCFSRISITFIPLLSLQVTSRGLQHRHPGLLVELRLVGGQVWHPSRHCIDILNHFLFYYYDLLLACIVSLNF